MGLKTTIDPIRTCVLYFQENVEKNGVKALALTSDIDEMEVLNLNLQYLANTVEVSQCLCCPVLLR